MKISKAEEHTVIDIETDTDRVYRRYNATDWDEQYGDSWEPMYNYEAVEKLEALYQEFIK